MNATYRGKPTKRQQIMQELSQLSEKELCYQILLALGDKMDTAKGAELQALQYEYDIASDEYKKACEAEDKVNGR
jgi:sulfur transfer protein SufE